MKDYLYKIYDLISNSQINNLHSIDKWMNEHRCRLLPVLHDEMMHILLFKSQFIKIILAGVTMCCQAYAITLWGEYFHINI